MSWITWVVVCSALQKRYFLPDFLIIPEIAFWKVFNQKYTQRNVGTFQFKMQVNKNIMKYLIFM
jgi:hypothetical protein